MNLTLNNLLEFLIEKRSDINVEKYLKHKIDLFRVNSLSSWIVEEELGIINLYLPCEYIFIRNGTAISKQDGYFVYSLYYEGYESLLDGFVFADSKYWVTPDKYLSGKDIKTEENDCFFVKIPDKFSYTQYQFRYIDGCWSNFEHLI